MLLTAEPSPQALVSTFLCISPWLPGPLSFPCSPLSLEQGLKFMRGCLQNPVLDLEVSGELGAAETQGSNIGHGLWERSSCKGRKVDAEKNAGISLGLGN